MTTEADNVLDLSDFDNDFGEAEILDRSEFVKIPDGSYMAAIDKVTDFEDMEGGAKRWSLFLKLAKGKYKGRFVFKNYWLDKSKTSYKDNLKYLKTDLATLGLKVNSLTEVAERRAELLNKHVSIQVKNNGEYQNVYINELVDASSEDDEPVSGDDLPF